MDAYDHLYAYEPKAEEQALQGAKVMEEEKEKKEDNDGGSAPPAKRKRTTMR